MTTTTTKATFRNDLLAAVTVGSLLLAASALGSAPATAESCVLGTKTVPACDLERRDAEGPVDSYLALPADFVGTRTVSSSSTWSGTPSCPRRFVALVGGEGSWTRLSVRPRSGPPSDWNECTCANMVAEVQVLSFSKHTYCQGGCDDCTKDEYCADSSECFYCSWTPLGLPSWPVASKKATGVWVTASPLTGPAHCELRVSFYRNSVSPSWEGDGALIGAVVYDRRTGTRYPVTVEARNSAADPQGDDGGCPSCQ